MEYDPSRRVLLALVYYLSCEAVSYIVAPHGVKVGDFVEAGVNTQLDPGNATLLRYIPLRVKLHNVEGHPRKGAQYCRSSGS